MLSGVGMEQLRQGQQPRGGLFASALSFVLDFPPYSFRSAPRPAPSVRSCVKNRTTLAPIAGALIILFGLHLLGVLIKLTFQIGIVPRLAARCARNCFSGLARSAFLSSRRGALFLAVVIGFFGPTLARWLNRDVHLRCTSKQPEFGAVSCWALRSRSDGLRDRSIWRQYWRWPPRARRFSAVCCSGGFIPPDSQSVLLTGRCIGQFLKFYQRSENICTPSKYLAARCCSSSAG